MPGSQGSPQQSKDDSWKEIAAALNESKKPKSKITSELKDTLSGYFGSRFDAPKNAAVKQRWIELDEKRGDEHAFMKTVQRHMAEAEEETGISPRGQLYTYDMFIDMLSGDFNPL